MAKSLWKQQVKLLACIHAPDNLELCSLDSDPGLSWLWYLDIGSAFPEFLTLDWLIRLCCCNPWEHDTNELINGTFHKPQTKRNHHFSDSCLYLQ